jgi:putative DNA primase/helicase
MTWEFVEEDALRDVLDEHEIVDLLENGTLADGDWLTAELDDGLGYYYPSGDEPRVDEFRRFHELLTEDAPDGYEPYYFRVAPASKAPATEHGSWKDERNRLHFEDAVAWMNYGGNVGVAGTPDGPLVNVDIDDEEETTEDDLKETLRAASRSRTGFHAWYFNSDGDVPNVPTDEYGEIRTNWQYVVAPGSFVASDSSDIPEDEYTDAGYYTVENSEPVAAVTWDELPDVFHEVHEEHEQAKEEVEERTPDYDTDTVTSEVSGDAPIMDISARDVVADQGGDTSGRRFTAIWHGSTTGTNMSVSDEGKVQCWRHNVAHGGLQALAMLSDECTLSCDDVGTGHKPNSKQRSTAGPCRLKGDPALLWYAWHGAKTETNLDAGAIPRPALRHVAREHTEWDDELVEQTNDDGDTFEALPPEDFNAARDVVEEDFGLDTGRDELPTGDGDGSDAVPSYEVAGGYRLQLVPVSGKEAKIILKHEGEQVYAETVEKGSWESRQTRQKVAAAASKVVPDEDGNTVKDGVREALQQALAERDGDPDRWDRLMRSEGTQDLIDRTVDVVVYPYEDGATWVITMSPPEESPKDGPQTFEFDGGQLNNKHAGPFLNEYLEKFLVRTELDSEAWGELTKYWVDEAEPEEPEVDVTKEAFIEGILDDLSGGAFTCVDWSDRFDAFDWGSRNAIYAGGEDGPTEEEAVLVPGQYISDKMDDGGVEFNLSKELRERGILLTTSERVRAGPDKQQRRVWCFDADETLFAGGEALYNPDDEPDGGVDI